MFYRKCNAIQSFNKFYLNRRNLSILQVDEVTITSGMMCYTISRCI
jgi:hypothetical protein